jgi:hypothetical protein
VDVFVCRKILTAEEADKEGTQVLEKGKAPEDILAGKHDVTEATLEVLIGNGIGIGGILIVNRSPVATKVSIKLAEKGS